MNQIIVKISWKRVFLQCLFILFISLVFGVAFNSFLPSGIPLVGKRNPFDIDTTAVRIITLEQAKKAFDESLAIFVDARSTGVFVNGHIKGAVNLFVYDFEKEFPVFIDKFSKETPLILYCDGKDCDLSPMLAKKLFDSGYRKISHFPGGWYEWVRADYPIDKK